jgi:hypothetical protein
MPRCNAREQIRKSPAAPSVSFPYAVTAAGVVLVGEARDAVGAGMAAAGADAGGPSFFNM